MQLVIENGPAAGTALSLDRDQPVTVGTGDGCALRLQDAAVAPEHAVIKALKGPGFGVKSLAKGLRVNRREVDAARLKDGDVLELGSTRIRFHTSDQVIPYPELGGMRLLEELGRGGMGVVYRAEQMSLNRQVALKVLSKDLTVDPVFVARFVAEARAAARLHHPNVVQVFDVGNDGDTYYYSMELLHEGSLEERLRVRGRLPVEQAVRAVADAASGLSYAESLRIVHRDIKPDNLMLDQFGTVKISDLGLALSDEDAGEKVLGTPHFMSPEQVLRKPLDHRSDLYALGCTFYRLITGKTPFSGATVKDILRAHVRDEPEPAHKINPEVPAEVSAIIGKLLAKEPNDRYQSADALLAELQELLAPRTRKALVIGSVVTALLVAGAALTYGLTRDAGEPQIIELYRDNPEALRLAQENQQLQAEVARLKARHSGLEGPALAEALDSMAQSHPDTDAAGRARATAQVLRAEQTRLDAQAAARAEAIANAVAWLREQTRDAISAGDYPAADAALRATELADELRNAQEVIECLAELREELKEDAVLRLISLRQAVDLAADGDPDQLAAALDTLETVVDPKAGWPAELANTSAVAKLIADGRNRVITLRVAREADQLERGWQTHADGLDQILAGMETWDLGEAANRAELLGDELGEHPGSIRARDLASLLRLASVFLDRCEIAAAADDLTVTWDGNVVSVLGFEPGGPSAGLTLNMGRRSRPRPELVPLARLRAEHWAEMAPSTGATEAEQRTFLAVAALMDHVREGSAYLQRIGADRDRSGTGEDGYSLNAAVLEDLLGQLPDNAASGFLDEQLRAGIGLVTGMRALSLNRPRAAAAHLDRLLAEFPHSIIVQALR